MQASARLRIQHASWCVRFAALAFTFRAESCVLGAICTARRHIENAPLILGALLGIARRCCVGSYLVAIGQRWDP